MSKIVTINPKVMHGAPCFAGTRVTVETSFDHLSAGYSVEGFLKQFPSVPKELVERFLLALQNDVSRLAVPT